MPNQLTHSRAEDFAMMHLMAGALRRVAPLVRMAALGLTGTAGEQQKRTLGNGIGRVAVAEVVQIAPPAKLQYMLSVNVPGVRITRPSGAVGTGGITRIRGSGSLSLSNEPLIYIDGIR